MNDLIRKSDTVAYKSVSGRRQKSTTGKTSNSKLMTFRIVVRITVHELLVAKGIPLISEGYSD
jgi:hypothetical protein